MRATRSFIVAAVLLGAGLALVPAGQAASCRDEQVVCPVVKVDATANATDEVSGPGTAGTFTVSLDTLPWPTDIPVKFNLTGTAVYGEDYVSTPAATGPSTSGQVTIKAGSTSATVSIAPYFDLASEDPETVILTIIEDVAYNIDEAGGNDTLTIPNRQANTVTASVVDAPFKENNDPVKLRVSRTGSFTDPLTVNVRMGGDALQGAAGDYTASPSLGTAADAQVQIPAGQASVDVVLTPVQDTASEELELVSLAIRPGLTSVPAQPSTHYHVGPASSVSVNLEDDEQPSISITANDPLATEAGETSGTFTLTRAGAKANSLTVLAALGGSAFPGDYDISGMSNSAVTFEPGAETAVVTITANQDATAEGTESVTLTIDASSTAYNVVGPAFATIQLQDDDTPTITLASTDYNATEAGLGTATITLTRSAQGLQNALQVLYTLGGTANATGQQRDYAVTPAGGKVNFTATTATATVTVTPLQDARAEPLETILFTLVQNGTAYGLATVNSIAVNLADDDASALDTDSDGVPDVTDNCDTTPNGQSQTGPDARQNNTDADAFGDACDPDDDNDGLTDASETTIHRTKTKVRDTDGDGRGDGDEVAASTKPLDRFSPEYRITSVRTRATGAGIEVNWTAPTGSLATRYLVFRASTPTLLAEVPAASPSTYLDDRFPGDNESHTYYVQPMLPGDVGSAFNATLAGGGSAPVKMPLCDAFTKDTDGDGLCDRDEEQRGTDADKADSDGDGVSDPDELDAGTDPLDPNSGSASRFDPLEVPFLAGVLLALAVLATLGVAIGMARRRKT